MIGHTLSVQELAALFPIVDIDTYTVTWARGDGALQTCEGLDLRTMAARLMGAIHASGPITVHSVVRDRAAP